jgi:hypothetical protein
MRNRLSVIVVVTAAVCAVLVASALAAGGKGGRLYVFGGELTAAPGPGATAVSLQVETGNRPALRALIGAQQTQSFSLDSHTEVLIWSNGVPKVGSTADLQAGDDVIVRIRAPGGSSLQEIESHPAAVVADHGKNAHGAGKPLWLFVGTVAGPQSGGHIALHVTSGNWRGLKTMLGQANLDQTFTYDTGTIFLLWQGRVPTVIDPSQLKAGDRITVRVRAPRASTLAQVEATPAARVGDHEPGEVESKTS